MISYWKIKICCRKRKRLLIASHCHHSLKATPHFWALIQNLHHSPHLAPQRTHCIRQLESAQKAIQATVSSKTPSPEGKSTHTYVGSANTKATCKIWLHHQYVDFSIYFYCRVIILGPCLYGQQKALNAVYQDTIKEKVNNIQNAAESSKTSASCTQSFQCQAPTHQPTAWPGVYSNQENLNGYAYTRESGDYQGDPQRPEEEESSEAEKRGCGHGKVMEQNEAKDGNEEMTKSWVRETVQMTTATGIKKGENMLNRALGGYRWRTEIQNGETETGRIR